MFEATGLCLALRALRSLAFAALLGGCFAQRAQIAPPPPGTQANPDGSITFRYAAAGAHSVQVDTDALPTPGAMTRDSTGVWLLTTPPLPPEHYSYRFIVDKVYQLDPLNHHVHDNLVDLYSDVLVPGHPPAPWELTAIPHGRVDRHEFTTQVGRNLPANQSAYLVYTPPGYDPARKEGYPVLYLLHSWSDSETAWDQVGQANLMLDAMLAVGKIVPMIVVMPLSYGDYDVITRGFGVWNDAAKIGENTEFFGRLLTAEIIPNVEREYNVARDRDHRAIAGASMGGLESVTIGLQHPELFGYVGSFSAAMQFRHFDERFPALSEAQLVSHNQPLHLLWVACGSSDSLLRSNRDFIAWARGKHLPVTAVETPGRHTWLVWRDNLLHFAPILFRNQ